MKDDYLIVDIGSKTKDVVYVQNRFPVESKSITIEKAMVKWIKEIQRDMKVQTGKDIPEHEVIKILLKEENHLPIVYAELINGMMREKICLLELELAERGYDMDYTNIIYVGGGWKFCIIDIVCQKGVGRTFPYKNGDHRKAGVP